MLIDTLRGRVLLAILALTDLSFGASSPADSPQSWSLSSSNPEHIGDLYETHVDHEIFYEGVSSGQLESKAKETDTSATLMQAITAGAFRGKKIRYSAFLKTRNVQKKPDFGFVLRMSMGMY
jgi:hypothetical protein